MQKSINELVDKTKSSPTTVFQLKAVWTVEIWTDIVKNGSKELRTAADSELN